MYANYHTHTVRCGHATGSEREYIENAIKAGIKILGFSDHAPMPFDGDYVSGIRMPCSLAGEYISTIRALAEEYKSDIKIYAGYEAEYYPRIFDRFIEFISKTDCDYLIMGQHFNKYEEGGRYNGAATDKEKDICSYVDEVIEGLSTGKFSYLAHPDLINYNGDSEIYKREMRKICIYAKENKIPLEINLWGLLYKRQYPNPLFWDIVAEVGADAVLGYDAHVPNLFENTELLCEAQEIAEKRNIHLVDEVKLINPCKV